VGGGNAASVIGAAVLVAVSPADLAVFSDGFLRVPLPTFFQRATTSSFSSRLSCLFSSSPSLASIKG